METILKILSNRKGSNPGAECDVYDSMGTFILRGYFKYCNGSSIPKDSSLMVGHQPIYEVLTLELARRLGLQTVNFYLVLNLNGNVRFEYLPGYDKINHSGREYYFLSEIFRENINRIDPNNKVNDALNLDIPYLEALLIDDIINKRQNYSIEANPNGNYRIKYIDLGCSFVRAVSGVISIPNDLNKIRRGSLKKMLKLLRGKVIISAGNDTFVNLDEIVDSIHSISLPTLNPFGRIYLNDCLTKSEIDEIQKYIAYGFSNSIRMFEKAKLIISS
ncbi:MAG: hypothetical protein N3D20_02575 [Candidatus Pacearchaeota archaeon]|nr:hypothetical protein [Candidatus Pacearchaeota archaeon]